MAKHHAVIQTIGSEEVIIDIKSSALGPIPAGTKLINDGGKRSPDLSDLHYDEGDVGFKVPKYKVTGAGPVYVKTARDTSDIRGRLDWKKAHLAKLGKSTSKKIADLGENKVNSLSLRKSEGETLDSDQQEDIDDFITDMIDIKDVDFHDAAAAEGYARFKSKLITGSGSRTVTLKRFPSGWVATDVITIIDQGKNVKEYQVTLTAVDSGAKTITFEDPSHTTTFKRNTSFAFKAAV